MSKQCPHCGSYNTEAAIDNYVGRGMVNIGRAALAIGASLIGSLGGPTTGKVFAMGTWKNTDPGEFKGHRCCNCGEEFV